MALQRRLLTRVLDALSQLERISFPSFEIDRNAAADRMRQGEPAWHAVSMTLPHFLLDRLVPELCQDLADAGAGQAAGRIGEAASSGRFIARSLMTASLARDQARIRAAADQLGFSPDILWLVGELAASPAAFLVQRHLLADDGRHHHDSPLGVSWSQGFCPVCGSWPALAELQESGKTLRCSFCAAAWPWSRDACIYCGDDGDRFVSAILDPEDEAQRLELCESCGGYLKVVTVDSPTPFPLIAIEDLASTNLDEAAVGRGFGRPALPARSAPARDNECGG